MKHSGKPVGVLSRTGVQFYFHKKDNDWPADYVYEDGISLTVMDYTDAVHSIGVYPSDYENKG